MAAGGVGGGRWRMRNGELKGGTLEFRVTGFMRRVTDLLLETGEGVSVEKHHQNSTGDFINREKWNKRAHNKDKYKIETFLTYLCMTAKRSSVVRGLEGVGVTIFCSLAPTADWGEGGSAGLDSKTSPEMQRRAIYIHLVNLKLKEQVEDCPLFSSSSSSHPLSLSCPSLCTFSPPPHILLYEAPPPHLPPITKKASSPGTVAPSLRERMGWKIHKSWKDRKIT